MNPKQTQYKAFEYLILTILVLTVVCILAAAALLIARAVVKPSSVTPPTLTTEATENPNTPTLTPPVDPELAEGEDAGMDYIDKMIFFGESTTTHLRSRGVLTGGTETTQVWADSSGTKTLSSKLLSETIVYPPTGEHLTLAEALKKEQPDYIVLSFGLNNLNAFIGNKSLYVNNYNKLITAIQQASPSTKILLQSVYPVSADCDDFSVDGATVCAHTQTLNEWLKEIAAAHTNVRYVNTAAALTNDAGTLKEDYDTGDGVHLTAFAYQQVLHYLRTHPWPETAAS
ncbi:MAG: hypothetical protein IJX28_04065 [Clostridia bacterium]|nr:hypothetical protein [Clostridia bacterium]